MKFISIKNTTFIYFSLFIAFFLSSFANTPKYDLLKAKIKGPVKVIEEFRYSTVVKFGTKHKNTLVDKFIWRYDKNGNLTESLYDYSNDLFDSRDIFKYDSKGNLIEQTKFNLHGNVISKFVKIYNDEGKMIESYAYDSLDKLYWKEVLDYDSKGNKIKTEMYCGPKIKREYQYDDNNNLLKTNSYDSLYNLINTVTFKYTDKGKLSEINNNNIDSYTVKTNYKYDERSHLIEEREIFTDTLGVMVTNIIYSKNGSKMINYNSKGKLNHKSEIKEIEFDDYGNSTKTKTIQINSSQKTIKLSERKIEYY